MISSNFQSHRASEFNPRRASEAGEGIKTKVFDVVKYWNVSRKKLIDLIITDNAFKHVQSYDLSCIMNLFDGYYLYVHALDATLQKKSWVYPREFWYAMETETEVDDKNIKNYKKHDEILKKNRQEKYGKERGFTLFNKSRDGAPAIVQVVGGKFVMANPLMFYRYDADDLDKENESLYEGTNLLNILDETSEVSQDSDE